MWEPESHNTEKLMLFGQFVGSWDLRWVGEGTDGRPATMNDELHFGWVLGGRAVQDVWIVPGRDEPETENAPMRFHGSTIRFYDPVLEAWRSTWIEPINGRVRRFIGHPVDGEIVLLSDEDGPQLRWRFTDIESDSFTWRAETSHDGSAIWQFDEQMFATRVLIN